jgi:hypothetical protein
VVSEGLSSGKNTDGVVSGFERSGNPDTSAPRFGISILLRCIQIPKQQRAGEQTLSDMSDLSDASDRQSNYTE